MAPDDFFESGSGDTEDELMAATYRALCEHGYADLTIERIGAEFEKSNSLLYHHYDGKDDLLVGFLEYTLERFRDDVPSESTGDPWEDIRRLLDHALAPTVADERGDFERAIVELRAQAAHDRSYREAFTAHDRFFEERLAADIRDGVATGRFRDVDPERVASLVHTALTGAMTRRATAIGGTDLGDADDGSDEAGDERDGSGTNDGSEIPDVDRGPIAGHREEFEAMLAARLLPEGEDE